MANTDYYASLSGDVKCRYDKKIEIINNIDPYKVSPSEFNLSVNDLPVVTILDMSEYLTHTHSYYTGMQLKAYKGLQAYKYFESGAVQSLLCKKIGECFVVLSKIQNSQRFREKPLDTWIILLHDGSISSAHCTCMAGLGEVCSHVAITLFYLLSRPDNNQELACTSRLAMWPVPAVKNVQIARVSEMEWSRPRRQDYKKGGIPEMTAEETVEFLRKLCDTGVSPAICRIYEPFASEMESEEPEGMPDSWQNLFKEEPFDKEYAEVLKVAETLDLQISEKQIDIIENITKKQSESFSWFKFRTGRVTASKFKSICKTSAEKPSLTIIKAICYPEKMTFFSKQTDYGIKHEKEALEDYFSSVKSSHQNLTKKECGFFISKTHVQLGASPDALVKCDCCGEGCVEIKCPFLLTGECSNIEEFAKRKNTCLIYQENNKIFLDRKHTYYYQVQLQMFVTQTLYCDFVVWCKDTMFMERILYDEDFCGKNISVALKFHKYVIIPELLGRVFTKMGGAAKVLFWCICKKPDDGRPMIMCDNDDCDVQWFHLECLNIKDIPAKNWFCNNCV